MSTTSNNPISPRNPLLVPDLFHCILESLVTPLPQRPSKEERRILAALARTCHAFSEPSLDRLWRRLNSLLPLVRCFSIVVDEARVKTPPSPHEWLVINRYSRRIQELTLGDECLSLHFLHRTGLVLPNLRVFRWKSPPRLPPSSEVPSHSIEFFWPLLTPDIVTLEINLTNTNDPKYQLFLENCSLLCPNLKSIKFNISSGIGDHKTVSQALSRVICSKADWQHIELSLPVDDVVLKHLGMSSTLRTVSLTLASQISRPDETCFGPADTPFRSVTDLSFVLWNPLDFVTCLLRPRDQVLRSFAVTLHTLPVATEVSALLSALVSPQRVHSLQSVMISRIPYLVSGVGISSSNMQGVLACQPLSHETFRPLASLVHLRKLVIILNHPTSLNDEEFAGLVRNWPLLEVLQMMWARGEHPVASITLKGLLSLLVSCRMLREIGLTLDARDVPVGAHADVCSPSITYPITFHNSPLKHPNLVAEFLSKHLPSVPGVSPSFTWGRSPASSTANNAKFNLEYQRLWLEVNKRIGHPVFSRWGDKRRKCIVEAFPSEEDYY